MTPQDTHSHRGGQLCPLPAKGTRCRLRPEPALLRPRSCPGAHSPTPCPCLRPLWGLQNKSQAPWGTSRLPGVSLRSELPDPPSCREASAHPHLSPAVSPAGTSSPKPSSRYLLGRKSPQRPPCTTKGLGSKASSCLAHLEARSIRSRGAGPSNREPGLPGSKGSSPGPAGKNSPGAGPRHRTAWGSQGELGSLLRRVLAWSCPPQRGPGGRIPSSGHTWPEGREEVGGVAQPDPPSSFFPLLSSPSLPRPGRRRRS